MPCGAYIPVGELKKNAKCMVCQMAISAMEEINKNREWKYRAQGGEGRVSKKSASEGCEKRTPGNTGGKSMLGRRSRHVQGS